MSLADLRTVLIAGTGLADHQVAENAVEQSTPTPYIVITGQTEPVYGLANNVQATGWKARVECWAGTAAEASDLADDATSALLLDSRLVTLRATGHDPEVGLDATVLTVEWWD